MNTSLSGRMAHRESHPRSKALEHINREKIFEDLRARSLFLPVPIWTPFMITDRVLGLGACCVQEMMLQRWGFHVSR
jgi:hypothetical protein